MTLWSPRSFLLVCVTTALIGGLSSCSDSTEDTQTYYDRAMQSLKEGKRKAAILDLQSAIQKDPKFGKARYELARIYFEDKDPAKAFQEFVRAADLDEKNTDANLKTGQFYLLGKNREMARKYIERALNSAPENDRALLLMANLEMLEGDFTRVRALIEENGKESSPDLQWIGIRARLFDAEDKPDEAERILKEGAVNHPDEIRALLMLMEHYRKTKNGPKIKETVEEMATRFPDDPRPHQFLANYWRRAGQPKKSEQELKKIVELTPESATPLLHLCEFYRQNGMLKKAEQTVEEGLKKFPDNDNFKVAAASMLFERRDFGQARKKLAPLKEKNPGAADVRLLDARLLFEEGKPAESGNLLLELVREYPRWASPWYYLAANQLAKGESKQALNSINQAIALNSAETRYHTFLASLQLSGERFTDAADSAKMALRLNASNLRAATLLGRAFIGEKKYKEAIEIFTRLNTISPDNITTLESLAIASFGAKDRKAGMKYLNQILTLEPGNIRALKLYLNLNYADDIKGALTYINNQLKKTPKELGLLMVRGDLLAGSGNTAEALTTFAEVKAINDSAAAPWIACGRILAAEGKIDEAIAEYKTALKLNPSSINSHMALANLLTQKGKTGAVKEQYEKILQLDPKFVPAANNLAWILASEEGGDLGRALQLAMLAKQGEPSNPKIIDTLGWVHLKRGSWQLAIAQFELALSSVPENPTLLYHLALAHRGSGDIDAAKETLTKIAADSSFPEKQEVEALKKELKQ